MTTDVDMGAFVIPGLAEIQDSFVFDGLASADPFRMYDAMLALHREKKMAARLRVFFLSMDTQPNLPLLNERLRNAFDGLGDDGLRLAKLAHLFDEPGPPHGVRLGAVEQGADHVRGR